jgi:hypothetical protein
MKAPLRFVFQIPPAASEEMENDKMDKPNWPLYLALAGVVIVLLVVVLLQSHRPWQPQTSPEPSDLKRPSQDIRSDGGESR